MSAAVATAAPAAPEPRRRRPLGPVAADLQSARRNRYFAKPLALPADYGVELDPTTADVARRHFRRNLNCN